MNALGAECFVPSVCTLVRKQFPSYINTSLVDRYCNWNAEGQRDIDKMCHAAYAKAQGAAEAQQPTAQYPWGRYSAATVAVQKDINHTLRAKGACAISQDGKLGAGTCGAARWAVSQGGGGRSASLMLMGGACKEYRDPSRPPCNGGGVSRTLASPPGYPATLEAYKAPGADRKWLYVGVAALGVGGVIVWRGSR